MPNISEVRALFDRWERVWHRGEFELVPSCVRPVYIRHDETGDRTVAREVYAAELAELKQGRPDVRIIVYEHCLTENSAWYRFTMRWTDQATGGVCTRAGLQSYRIEEGKLAETWVVFRPMGSNWSDAVAQDSWTSPVGVRAVGGSHPS
ncbi:ester cyclase [Bradyrhizobium sp. WD16]|uniref:ester cyclase n=1 Tax=Bradyrhizobium sp. WD16 TaxID=1521768 RepID=UPI0020A53301|nr:ester cyclase [Bradyrhizobium sp. WD16]UTD25661.1 hypothetical protein DB459_00785 [Bradyrhizobium sp. WD16]